jgi:hypothetical protein
MSFLSVKHILIVTSRVVMHVSEGIEVRVRDYVNPYVVNRAERSHISERLVSIVRILWVRGEQGCQPKNSRN